MVALGGRAEPKADFGGLEQFARRGRSDEFDYCIAGGKPYALEFANNADVVCLLLGDIHSATQFEQEREAPLMFEAETSAFHPRGGSVRVDARRVLHGFVAFSYAPGFQNSIEDGDLAPIRSAGSRNNIQREPIKALARYARARLREETPLLPLELECLAALVYIETVRGLRATRSRRTISLSDDEFTRLSEFVDAHIERSITCAAMARAIDLPLRVVFEGMKARTGYSLYRFVVERRLERAQALLATPDGTIADIALACGFSSQQHLTATMSRRMGTTPAKLRLSAKGQA